MVAVARQTLAPFGDWASGQPADAADLPFEDGRFSVVLPATMLHHVMAWDEALAEAVRVLCPGGLLFGCDLLDNCAGPGAAPRWRPRHQIAAVRPSWRLSSAGFTPPRSALGAASTGRSSDSPQAKPNNRKAAPPGPDQLQQNSIPAPHRRPARQTNSAPAIRRISRAASRPCRHRR
jgi:SAM-dependent methyltransferase